MKSQQKPEFCLFLHPRLQCWMTSEPSEPPEPPALLIYQCYITLQDKRPTRELAWREKPNIFTPVYILYMLYISLPCDMWMSLMTTALLWGRRCRHTILKYDKMKEVSTYCRLLYYSWLRAQVKNDEAHAEHGDELAAGWRYEWRRNLTLKDNIWVCVCLSWNLI